MFSGQCGFVQQNTFCKDLKGGFESNSVVFEVVDKK